MKKLLLLATVMLASLFSAAPGAQAETLRDFVAGLAKGETATFDGELTCTFSDETYLFLQDATAGIRVNTNGSIKRGDKINNVTIWQSQWGTRIFGIDSYTLVSTGATVTPVEVTLDKLEDYNDMLVKVNDVTFPNAGFTFALDAFGAPVTENITVGNETGKLQPFNSNIIGSKIPATANVTAIAHSNVLQPRDLADIDTQSQGDDKEETFARFLEKMVHYGTETFKGKLLITYAERGASNITLVFQDNTAGAYGYVANTDLKAGDLITDVEITQVASAGRFEINSYTLVSHDNPVEPTDVNISDLGDTSAYKYMYVRLLDAEIKPDAAGVFGMNAKYPVSVSQANPGGATVGTHFCLDLVGQPIPLKADITGINFFGYQIRPIAATGIVSKGENAASNIPEYATLAEYKAAMASNPVARVKGPVYLTLSNVSNNYGTVILQDAGSALTFNVNGIALPETKLDGALKNVALNYADLTAFISSINGVVAEAATDAPALQPTVLEVGGLNGSNIEQLLNMLVEYRTVKFKTADNVFSDTNTFPIVNSSATVEGLVYPFAGLNNVQIPAGYVNVRGLAAYNSEDQAYYIRPRVEADITKSTEVPAPAISFSPAELTIKATVGEPASADVTVTMANCTGKVTISTEVTDVEHVITPSVTELDPVVSPATVKFTFAPKVAGIVTETFLFATEGLAQPVKLVVKGDATTGVEIIAADAEGRFRVYNAAGILVLDTTEGRELQTLPAGLYIVNGRKLAIR